MIIMMIRNLSQALSFFIPRQKIRARGKVPPPPLWPSFTNNLRFKHYNISVLISKVSLVLGTRSNYHLSVFMEESSHINTSYHHIITFSGVEGNWTLSEP